MVKEQVVLSTTILHSSGSSIAVGILHTYTQCHV